ncbi:MAG: hypothetical protein ACI3X1_06065 [Eubacteriales bacterium]
MKKFLALLLAAICCLSLGMVAVSADETSDPFEGMAVMTHEQYIAAENEAPVKIEAYVQATQSWWKDKITVYLQDKDGAYFAYEMACSEEDAAKLVPGTKIRVCGYKGEWSGEVEIVDATFTFVDGADTYIAEPADLTSILANEEELLKHQNELAVFNNLLIEKIEYKNGEPGDDIYVTVKQGVNSFVFCVERYLTGPETDLYKAFATLKAGDVVNITGFVYWYNGVNTHITAVENVITNVTSHADYIAAEMDTPVVIKSYVQATQSWWSDKITVYLQSEDGAYLAYNMACSEEDAAKLVPGTEIIVYGYKGEWSGEVEVVDATFIFGGETTFKATPADLTDILANETELLKHQNEFAIFKGLTIEKIEYKNGEPGDDIYVTVKQGDNTFNFCVERYLTDPDTDVYKAFATLKAGDKVDITGFVYWYNGVNTHITAVEASKEAIETPTETSTQSPTETSTEAHAEFKGGCGSVVGMGTIALVTLAAAGLVSFRKKED